ncbi:RNA polymerase sigma factor [Actinocrinis puniceicyclus]|uniref:RNA polymerase sigma factor n=1 Tax=Actinocrinis puniceicyclus TaxID=977794 RepID=A0A8J8BCL0_9ACTN|nr:RNA polymerase sigma factor [Actinocrinis puniceicyclus]MBS2963231.1 RNA polymerase sigma factor [Actinocrinis puniceicyclus]
MTREEPPTRAGSRLTGYLHLSFTVFVEKHQIIWLKFAHLNVGAEAAAEEIVDEVTAQLAENWEHALAQDSVERYALNLVKTAVVRWQAEHAAPCDFVPNAAFLRAIRDGRNDFAVLDESLGLFSAISELPERQYMVIVLCFVLGYSDQDAARLLGIKLTTVRTHIHHARRRLAKQLDLRAPDCED